MKFYFLSFVAVVIAILYLVEVLNCYPIIVSGFMSIIGISILWRSQILDARQFTDHRPNTPRNAIMLWPTGKPIEASLRMGMLGSLGLKARATVSIPEDATIGKKVDFLLHQVNDIQAIIGNLDDRIDAVDTSQTNKSREIKTEIDNLKTSLEKTIAGHIVGTYDANFFGIIITMCGILIQSFRS
jgi:hypothetical protein